MEVHGQPSCLAPWKAAGFAGMGVVSLVVMGFCWLDSSMVLSRGDDLLTFAWGAAALVMVGCALLAWLLSGLMGTRVFARLTVIAAVAVVILVTAATLEPDGLTGRQDFVYVACDGVGVLLLGLLLVAVTLERRWITSYGVLKLTQSGASVSGNYDSKGGRIAGTVQGRRLVGAWSEAPSYLGPSDAGDFEFTMAADEKSFSGRRRDGSSGDWDEWNGNLTKRLRVSFGLPVPQGDA